MEGVILNDHEAILFVNGRGIMVWESSGKVRDLVQSMFLPIGTNPECTPIAYGRIMSEDTTEIEVA